MYRLASIGVCVVAAVSFAMLQGGVGARQTSSGETAEVKLEVVKQQDYLKKMESLHGKVVVVDVWGEFCPPCKAEFPHLVEMYEKYAAKGLACVSISLDPLENQGDALKFLRKQKATFTNVLLDEKNKVWQDHFGVLGPPAVFVYDRRGKLAARFHGDEKPYTYQDVEKIVQRMLEK